MISKFDDLEKIASWNQILKDSITGTIFITPTWQETWLNNYQPQATLFLGWAPIYNHSACRLFLKLDDMVLQGLSGLWRRLEQQHDRQEGCQ